MQPCLYVQRAWWSNPMEYSAILEKFQVQKYAALRMRVCLFSTQNWCQSGALQFQWRQWLRRKPFIKIDSLETSYKPLGVQDHWTHAAWIKCIQSNPFVTNTWGIANKFAISVFCCIWNCIASIQIVAGNEELFIIAVVSLKLGSL